ncbi:S41 family peptidase [Limnovirga soli]|uniref:PDZ domain-containing protein n=1 Tax=Limnovirga soli TaxID=2656915 RepID=A0A8J8JTD1_9BACT|nr:S41 family peptidase [Limnovirga soli]NNV55788.1 PDZ domain-containing protein [Limnovirga soli]
MVNKKLQVWLPLLFAVVLAIGMALGYQLKEDTSGGEGFMSNTRNNSLQEVLTLIENRYVDSVSVDSLKETAINTMLAHLDPHSIYIPPVEIQEVNEDMQGNFMGIGVEFQIFDDTVNIVNVIPDGPSFKAGVQVGDKLIKVNDTASVAGKHIMPDDIKKLLRGPGGSNVSVTVLRNNKQQRIKIDRGIIPLPSVDAAYMMDSVTGFIHINKFSETTYPEFMAAMEKLQGSGLLQLVLDLRGNGGGVLQQAVNIADEFLDNDKMIVYTQGNKAPKIEYRCSKEGVFETGKLVVLVDETSASASEILSGALQDWDRATIIGRRTFGKGLVQQQYPLSDGGALRLTIARYYTPIGRNIQKPYNKGLENYEDELMQRFHDGEVVHGDTALPKGPAFKTKGGKTVYGGGGITPDVFVPFDTTSQPKEILQLYIKNTLNNFIYQYYMQNKSAFTGVKTPKQLSEAFKPGENEWQQLNSFATKDTINLSHLSALAKSELLQKMPTLMARQIWRAEGYYEVSNQTDPMLAKAMQAFK